jgi:hypothetical protein
VKSITIQPVTEIDHVNPNTTFEPKMIKSVMMEYDGYSSVLGTNKNGQYVFDFGTEEIDTTKMFTIACTNAFILIFYTTFIAFMFMTICIAYTLTNAFAIAIINGTF